MTDDDRYLWDRSGPPDPEVLRLERLLAPLAHQGSEAPLARPRSALLAWIPFAAAASLAVASLAAWGLSPGAKGPADAPGDGGPAAPALVSEGVLVPAGSWIQTADGPREIALGGSGHVTLDPGSRLQVKRVAAEETRLYLERGSLEARIAAHVRPRFFQVDTRAARCVDLGCRYTLAVDDAGVSRVRVLTGQVSFETETREVYVPRGATCVARPGSGPGTPRFDDADEALGAAADAFDAAAGAPTAQRRALASALLSRLQTARDGLVGWHLLQDPDAEVATSAERALTAVVGRPEGLAAHPGAPTSSDRERWRAHLESRGW